MIWHVNCHSSMTASNRPEAKFFFSLRCLPFTNVTVLDLHVCELQSSHHDSFWSLFLLQLCIYFNTRVCSTSKTKNNCQVLASSLQLFDISAEAAMHRIWFPYELFLSLARKSSTHLWPLSAFKKSALFHLVTQQSHRWFQSQMCSLSLCVIILFPT